MDFLLGFFSLLSAYLDPPCVDGHPIIDDTILSNTFKFRLSSIGISQIPTTPHGSHSLSPDNNDTSLRLVTLLDSSS